MLAHQTDAIQHVLTGDIATGTVLARQSIDEPVRAVRTICVHSKQRMCHMSCGVDDTAFRLFFDKGNLYLFPDDQTTRPIGPITMDHPVPHHAGSSAGGEHSVMVPTPRLERGTS